MDATAGATAIVELDDHGRYLDANEVGLRLYGVTLHELRGRRIGDFSRPGLRHIHRALFLWLAAHHDDSWTGESTIVRSDGRDVRVRCSVFRVGDRIRVDVMPVPGPPCHPRGDRKTVLKAWRTAERQMAEAASSAERFIAGRAFVCLREIYARL